MDSDLDSDLDRALVSLSVFLPSTPHFISSVPSSTPSVCTMKDGKQRAKPEALIPSGRGTYAKQACSHCRKRYAYPSFSSPSCDLFNLRYPAYRKSKCDGRAPVCGPCEKAGRASEVRQQSTRVLPPFADHRHPPRIYAPFSCWHSFPIVYLGEGDRKKGPHAAALRISRKLHPCARGQGQGSPIRPRVLPEAARRAPFCPLPRRQSRRRGEGLDTPPPRVVRARAVLGQRRVKLDRGLRHRAAHSAHPPSCCESPIFHSAFSLHIPLPFVPPCAVPCRARAFGTDRGHSDGLRHDPVLLRPRPTVGYYRTSAA